MKRIPLSAFYAAPRAYALVDDEDFDLVGTLTWSVTSRAHAIPYAIRNRPGGSVQMHRMICGLASDDPRVVDHVNGNGLDNRRANLRVVTNAENMRNRRPRSFGTSRYRGVYWNTRQQKWFARAKVDYRHVWLGAFTDEDAAGAAVEAFWRDFDVRALDASRNGLKVQTQVPDEDTLHLRFDIPSEDAA